MMGYLVLIIIGILLIWQIYKGWQRFKQPVGEVIPALLVEKEKRQIATQQTDGTQLPDYEYWLHFDSQRGRQSFQVSRDIYLKAVEKRGQLHFEGDSFRSFE